MREDDHITRNNVALFDEYDIAFDDSIWVNESILSITFDQDFVPFHSVWLCLDSVYFTDYKDQDYYEGGNHYAMIQNRSI